VIDVLRSHLDEASARGLAHAVSRAVGDGSLAPGTRLPPIRTVARELHLSPTTVSGAWNLLARSGTIRTDGRRGSFVAGRPRTGPVRYRRALEHAAQFELDLSAGVPDPNLLPELAPTLRRLHLKAETPETYLDEPVLPELRDVLADGWPWPVEAITVVDGAMDALDLIVTCFVRFGDRVAVENPCFPPLLDLLESAGALVVPVALDDDGPVPAALQDAVDIGAQTFFLQPRAQNPTGSALSERRRDELARILSGGDVLVIENDSAGDVAASELVSLGTRRPQRTVHIHSFSKSHGPDLRLAAVGGAAEVVETLVERRRLGQGWTSRLLQRILLDLLVHREAIQQVERARRTYARRRSSLARALADEGVAVGGRDGLNLWIPVLDEPAALVALASRGIGAAAGAPFLVDRGDAAFIRVTSGVLADGARDVARAVALAGAAPAPTARR